MAVSDVGVCSVGATVAAAAAPWHAAALAFATSVAPLRGASGSNALAGSNGRSGSSLGRRGSIKVVVRAVWSMKKVYAELYLTVMMLLTLLYG